MKASINYDWKYPAIFEPVISYNGRYIALTGGRGSGKSWFVAHLLLEKAMYQKADILCAREHQSSIEKSSYKLLTKIINKYKLPYKIQKDKIVSLITGAQFDFIGLSDETAENVKSSEGYRYVWLEEAQAISKKSWEYLDPTIRPESNGQIIVTMNPNVPHYKHPIMSELTTFKAHKTLHIHSTYLDNPFIDADNKENAELTKIHKPEDYEHIWLGIPRDESLNNVVKGFTNDNIAPITYQPDMPLHLTWDFNVDPMSCICAHKTADKVFYFDEFILENASTEQTIKEVINRYPDHRGPIIINGDASGDNRSTQSEWSNYVIIRNVLQEHYRSNQIKVQLRPFNPRIKNRIAAFNAKVKNYKGEIGLFVDPKCQKLLYNIYNLKYKVGTDIVDVPTYSQIKSDINLKYLEHPFDAASYLVEFYWPLKVEEMSDS